MSVWVWTGIALLGGAGAVARFLLGAAVARRTPDDLPFGTLAVNLSGAFALGVISALGLRGTALLLAGTATIGAYTTFSTWMAETHWLAGHAQRRAAVLNIAFGIIGGIAMILVGRMLAG